MIVYIVGISKGPQYDDPCGCCFYFVTLPTVVHRGDPVQYGCSTVDEQGQLHIEGLLRAPSALGDRQPYYDRTSRIPLAMVSLLVNRSAETVSSSKAFPSRKSCEKLQSQQ